MFKKIDINFIYLLVGRLLQAAIAVFTIRLITETLPEREIGNQYIINSIALYFSWLLINPVGMFVNRQIHQWREGRHLYYFFKKLNIYFLLIGALSLPVVYAAKKYLGIAAFLSDFQILLYIAAYVYLSTWFQTLISFFNLFNLQKIFILLNISAQIVGIFFGIIFIKYIDATALWWMTALLIGQVIFFIIAIFVFLNKFPPNEYSNKPSISFFSRSTFEFCYPVAFTTIFIWFMNQGYRLIIERNLGIEAVASLGIGLGLTASLAGLAESIATQYFYPSYYSSLVNSTLNSRSLAWENIWKKTLIIYIPSCFLIISLSALVVRVLTTPIYYHVVRFIWFGAFIELFRQLSNIAQLVTHAEKMTYKSIAPYMFGGITLAITLFVFKINSILTIETVLILLIVAGIFTYFSNILVVRSLLRVNLHLKMLLSVLIISLPQLLTLLLVNVQSSFSWLFAMGFINGLWYLGSVYYLLARIK